jgi:hypothetical protein
MRLCAPSCGVSVACHLIAWWDEGVAKRPAPRLFVIMAAVAPVAVVIRRGPSAWSQLTLWNTATDAFTEGAWFRGRIYAEKCDLSPDGKLFVYAALKGGDSWTAVSRPPWLEALALWPMGTTYGGGGRFADDRRLVLRGIPMPHPDQFSHGLDNGLEVEWTGDLPGISVFEAFMGLECHRSTDELEGAEWTGRDQGNRLVFVRGGCIFEWGKPKPRLLADFNGQTPDPKEAPAWARATRA